MASSNINNVMIVFGGNFEDQCLLQLAKTNKSKNLIFRKNGIEIFRFNFESEFQLQKIQRNKSLLVNAKHEQIT
ncbi:hypothetical protein BpHYR1_003052, partial [Brachionus plicatilis]